MTIREYILQKLQPFGNLSEAELLDISVCGGFDLNNSYDVEIAKSVGKALTKFIEEKTLAPAVTSVSESGFSISWDYSNLGKYYLYLCNKYGIKPNEDVLGMLGISMIIDKTDIW